MKRKTVLYILLIILLSGLTGVLYIYKEYNRRQKDVATMDADYKISHTGLIGEFMANESAANKKYLDKTLAITGRIKTIDKDEKGYYTIVLGDSASMSAVRCSMDSVHNNEAALLHAGERIQVKGLCTGFTADDLLGADVQLSRCAVIK